MGPSDWYIEAVRRFGAGIVVAFVFGALAYLVNRRWVAPLLPNSPSLALRAALLLACCIGLVGGVGAVQFAITKPFM
jgi:NhaP-type Na+/H+ and K+/H+ antiporter